MKFLQPMQPYSVTTPGDFVPAHSVPDVLVPAAFCLLALSSEAGTYNIHWVFQAMLGPASCACTYKLCLDLQAVLGSAGYAGTCRLSWDRQASLPVESHLHSLSQSCLLTPYSSWGLYSWITCAPHQKELPVPCPGLHD